MVANMVNRWEMARGLDRVGEPLRRRVTWLLRGRLRDILHGVWLGHPLHPALMQLPAGSWVSAAIADAVPGAGPAATVLMGVGTVSALPTAVTGLNDWSSLAVEQRRVGLVHAGTMVLAVGLSAGSWVARLRGHRRVGRALTMACVGVASAGAYLGGHLSYWTAAGVNQAEPFLRQIPEGWHDLCAYDALAVGKTLVAHIGDVPVLLSRSAPAHGADRVPAMAASGAAQGSAGGADATPRSGVARGAASLGGARVAPDGAGAGMAPDGATVTAMIEHCGHHTGPLGDGDLVRVDGSDCVVCPWHGSTFRLSDGVAVRGPATTGQPLLRTRVVGGRVQAALP